MRHTTSVLRLMEQERSESLIPSNAEPGKLIMESTAELMKQRILAGGLAGPEEIIGCTPEEIRALEVIHEVKLPSAYCEFLATMGQGMGRLFNPYEGYGVLFANVKYLNWEVRFREFLFPADCLLPKVPDTAFFIGTIQSMDYWYLDLAEDPNDPPVWGWGDSWIEDHESARCRLFSSVWDWVEAELESRMHFRTRNERLQAGLWDEDSASNDVESLQDLLFRGIRKKWQDYKDTSEAARRQTGNEEECPF